MFTWGSKFFFGTAAAFFLGATAYGLATGGGPVGVISMGYKGGVGEHTGYTILLSAGYCLLIAGIVSVIVRDGDAEDMSALVGSEQVVAVRPPLGLSSSPAIIAFGVACLALGISTSRLFLYLGLAAISVAGVLWVTQAWADRATGDPATNRVIRDRVVGPFEVPMLSVLTIAVVVISLSRILLAVSKVGSVVLASVAAAFVFGAAILIAKSNAPRAIVSAIVGFGVMATLVGGVIGAVEGPRDFHHGEEHGEHGEDHSDEGQMTEEGLSFSSSAARS
jgi:hypothetical protein